MAAAVPLLLGALLAAAAGSDAKTIDWGAGPASWVQAMLGRDGEDSLWTEENECAPEAIRGSAPLSVLFGISKMWRGILKHREAHGVAATAPLEIHVPGAAYPFEGRSDWSLLAKRRPAGIEKVRVVLVLGTPWQADNVPRSQSDERNPDESLLQTGQRLLAPRRGKLPSKWRARWNGEALVCANHGMEELDEEFHKEDLCKDHGNGLEVVCLEKYYQDVYNDLPKPDAVVMFSPGFPQLGRRSWDVSLRHLLDENALMMVVDLLEYETSLRSAFQQRSASSGSLMEVHPGRRWRVRHSSMEDGMTLLGLDAYHARRLGSWRNPFPLLHHKTRERKIAKNAVIQAFRGRLEGRPSSNERLPDAEVLKEERDLILKAPVTTFSDSSGDERVGKEHRDSMLTPVSLAYENAMRDLYEKDLRRMVEERGLAKFSKSDRATIERMGLAGVAGRKQRSRKRARWGAKEWIFLFQVVGAGDLV